MIARIVPALAALQPVGRSVVHQVGGNELIDRSLVGEIGCEISHPLHKRAGVLGCGHSGSPLLGEYPTVPCGGLRARQAEFGGRTARCAGSLDVSVTPARFSSEVGEHFVFGTTENGRQIVYTVLGSDDALRARWSPASQVAPDQNSPLLQRCKPPATTPLDGEHRPPGGRCLDDPLALRHCHARGARHVRNDARNRRCGPADRARADTATTDAVAEALALADPAALVDVVAGYVRLNSDHCCTGNPLEWHPDGARPRCPRQGIEGLPYRGAGPGCRSPA
jgi:hypothetical protein